MEYVRTLLVLWVESGDDGIGALQCCEKACFCCWKMFDAGGCHDQKWRACLLEVLEVDNNTGK
jgi:hypothetical protein